MPEVMLRIGIIFAESLFALKPVGQQRGAWSLSAPRLAAARIR
jgi:hypothetical protein